MMRQPYYLQRRFKERRRNSPPSPLVTISCLNFFLPTQNCATWSQLFFLFLLSAETCQLGHNRFFLVIISHFCLCSTWSHNPTLSLSLSLCLSLSVVLFYILMIGVSGECVVKKKCWFTLFTGLQPRVHVIFLFATLLRSVQHIMKACCVVSNKYLTSPQTYLQMCPCFFLKQLLQCFLKRSFYTLILSMEVMIKLLIYMEIFIAFFFLI